MAARANLRIEQGTNFSADVTVKDTDGNALNLTGYTSEAKMSKGYSSTQTRTVLTTTIGSPLTGVISLSLPASITSDLEDGRYVYDVEITQTSTSTVTRVLEGIITVSPSVT
jgi:hypothetical protein